MSQAIATPVPGDPTALGRSGPSEDPQRALLALGLMPIGAFMLAGAGLALGLEGPQLQMHLIGVFTALICFLPPAIDRIRPAQKRHVFLSIFTPVFAIYFVMGIYTDYFFYPESLPATGRLRLLSIDPNDIVRGQLAALLGLIAMIIGFLLPLGSVGARLFPAPRADWPLGSTLRVALVLTAIGWSILLMGQFGVLPGFLGSGFLGAFASSFYFGAAILMIAWLRFKSPSALVVMMVLVPPTMLFSMLTGSKKLFLSPLAVVAMTHIMYTRRLRISWFVMGGLLLVAIYPFASFYREAIQIGNQLGVVEVLRNPGRLINGISVFIANIEPYEYLMSGVTSSSTRLSALGILTVIVRDTPQYVPFQDGWTIGNTLVAFVPRILWPGKPTIGIGQWVTDNYTAPGHIVASQTGCSWIGELYLNYGWAGIAIGMLMLGVYFRFLQDALMRSTQSIPIVLAGVVVLWQLLPALQGTLQAPLNGVPFAMIPVIFAHMLVRLFFGAVPYRHPGASAPRGAGAGP